MLGYDRTPIMAGSKQSVGVGEAVIQNDKLKECRQVCAINDTCWQDKWLDDAGDLSCVVAGNQIKLSETLFADWSTANWIGKAVCK